MTDLPPLSRREREVMDIIHEMGDATAARIRERMAEPPNRLRRPLDTQNPRRKGTPGQGI